MNHKLSPLLRVVVLASGRGSNFNALIENAKIEPKEFEVVRLVTDKQSAKAIEIAKLHKIPASYIAHSSNQQEFNRELLAATLSAKPDLVVLAGFMRILTNNFIEPLLGKLINVHPSLLPAFKGLNAQRQALKAGVTETGCTVHFVTPEVDSGEIIAQSAVAVKSDDTVESLAARILIEEHKLLPQVVREFARKHARN